MNAMITPAQPIFGEELTLAPPPTRSRSTSMSSHDGSDHSILDHRFDRNHSAPTNSSKQFGMPFAFDHDTNPNQATTTPQTSPQDCYSLAPVLIHNAHGILPYVTWEFTSCPPTQYHNTPMNINTATNTRSQHVRRNSTGGRSRQQRKPANEQHGQNNNNNNNNNTTGGSVGNTSTTSTTTNNNNSSNKIRNDSLENSGALPNANHNSQHTTHKPPSQQQQQQQQLPRWRSTTSVSSNGGSSTHQQPGLRHSISSSSLASSGSLASNETALRTAATAAVAENHPPATSSHANRGDQSMYTRCISAPVSPATELVAAGRLPGFPALPVVADAPNDGPDLERFLHAVTPTIPYPDRPEAVANLQLNDLWKFFEKPSAFGLECPTLGGARGPSNCYFVPFLSALQLFEPVDEEEEEKETESGLVVEGRKGNYPLLSSSTRTRREKEQEQEEQEEKISDDTPTATASGETYIYPQGLDTWPPAMRRCFSWSADDHVAERLPFTEQIAELSTKNDDVRAENNGASGAVTHSITTSKILDMHPYSWFAVAWYPLYRIPEGPFTARFLTFHSFAPLWEAARAAHVHTINATNDHDGTAHTNDTNNNANTNNTIDIGINTRKGDGTPTGITSYPGSPSASSDAARSSPFSTITTIPACPSQGPPSSRQHSITSLPPTGGASTSEAASISPPASFGGSSHVPSSPAGSDDGDGGNIHGDTDDALLGDIVGDALIGVDADAGAAAAAGMGSIERASHDRIVVGAGQHRAASPFAPPLQLPSATATAAQNLLGSDQYHHQYQRHHQHQQQQQQEQNHHQNHHHPSHSILATPAVGLCWHTVGQVPSSHHQNSSRGGSTLHGENWTDTLVTVDVPAQGTARGLLKRGDPLPGPSNARVVGVWPGTAVIRKDYPLSKGGPLSWEIQLEELEEGARRLALGEGLMKVVDGTGSGSLQIGSEDDSCCADFDFFSSRKR